MRTGLLDGKINGLWQVVEDSGELGSAVTSYTFSNLNGDVDEEYELICRHVGGEATGSGLGITLNGDTGANYGFQWIYGESTSGVANRNTSYNFCRVHVNYATTNTITFADVKFQVKSGKVRTFLSNSAALISGTTVTDVASVAGVWNNTADNVTSIVITATAASGLGVGTRLILLKKVHATDGIKTGVLTPASIKGCWQRVYDSTVAGAAAASVTITGLSGDADVIYRLITRPIIVEANGAPELRINGDTGNNYGNQYLSGAATSVGAARELSNLSYLGLGGFNINGLEITETLLYAKSGYVRTLISQYTDDITTTTVSRSVIGATSWNNTGDNITSLTVYATTGKLGIGTHIELYKLVL